MSFGVKQRETQYTQSRAHWPAHWASLEPEAAMAALGASRAGLNKAEVAERLARYGHNTLPRLRRRPWYLELSANFVHLFALLLWAGAGLAWVAGMPQLAWAIIAVILINGLFSFWQEYQAERAVERGRHTAEDLIDDIKEGGASQARRCLRVSIRAQRQVPVN